MPRIAGIKAYALTRLRRQRSKACRYFGQVFLDGTKDLFRPSSGRCFDHVILAGTKVFSFVSGVYFSP